MSDKIKKNKDKRSDSDSIDDTDAAAVDLEQIATVSDEDAKAAAEEPPAKAAMTEADDATLEKKGKPEKAEKSGKGDKAKDTDKDAEKEKDADPDAGKPLGTAKGVETLFRNAYRAELDIIALAATKANIMISLNGFIISALMISGAFIFAESPAFLLPAGIFMVTAAASIVFALLAASPERADLLGDLWGWLTDFVRGRAGWRDLRTRVIRGRDLTDSDTPNILVYDDRVRMSREEYWERMQDMMRDRDDVYFKMSDQLYSLGLMANRKFKLLNISYTVFRWGLLASLISFISLKSILGLFPALTGQGTPARLSGLGIAQFDDIYEPSAVQQLPDGRLLVVEDEATRAMSLLSVAPDGSLSEDSVADLRLTRGFGRKLSDLEGLSVDDRDQIYAITSHSMTGKGERNPDREQLLRFEIRGGSAGNIRRHTGLRDALAASQPLAEAISAQAGGETPDFEGLNIEGLAFHRQSQTLMLGLRAPMVAGKSIIVPIENPDQVFDDEAEPAFGQPMLLDLSGGGIRALSYDPVLDAFLIVNEIEGPDGSNISQMWSWSGAADAAPVPLALPDIINLNNVESVDSIVIDGQPRLLLMSDEGNAKKERGAKYMMLDYDHLGQ